ncbi:MAG: uroporphyrinogen decarboxylase family protein [Armatimonadota bacterium]
MLTPRENYIRNVRFQGPEWIPVNVHISDASWDQYRNEMEEVALRYPMFFPHVKPGWRDFDNYDFGPANTKGVPFTDAWGCTWVSSVNGLEGTVHESPLTDWDKLDTYKVPDPNLTADRGPIDWNAIRGWIESLRASGQLTQGSVAHGFLFLRLQYLRGFDNFMIDVATDEPNLQRLIDMVVEHNLTIVRNYLDIGVDVMVFGDDLGTQTSTILSPNDFRKWIKPAYEKIMAPCKEAGTIVFLHSDGRTLDILEDQIAAGVDIVNPQDLANGIDNIAKYIKGKAAICLDIDRQTIVPFGTRKDIHDLIEEEVRKLGSPQGGLEFIAGIYPPTPPENVDALCEALLKYRTYWWD